jgi:arylsulfatase A-like enzyme
MTKQKSGSSNSACASSATSESFRERLSARVIIVGTLTPIRKSVVLVTVDCLRADHVGFNGYSRNVTPFLDSLAHSSVTFSDAIVAGAPTYFSFPAISASRYPLALGRDVLGIAPGETTIASVLRGAGCKTAAFLAGNPYLSARCGYDEGFERFEDFLTSPVIPASVPEKSEGPIPGENRLSGFNRWLQRTTQRTRLTAAAYEDLYFRYCQWVSARESDSMDSLRRYPAADVIVDHAGTWLREIGNEPFFLWIHLMDPHHPYYPPEKALRSLGVSITAQRARFLNSCWNRDIRASRLQRYREEMISLYDAGICWVDQQISRLVGTLQELQRWDETFFAVTGDHGESFLEHGARYHSPTNLHEPLIRVPLLLRAEGLPSSHISDEPFSLIHLAPTLLQGAGVAIPRDFQGFGYWQEIATGNFTGEPAVTECVEFCDNPFRRDDRMRPRMLAVRDRDSKLIIRFRENSDDFYDLSHDREERSPFSAEKKTRERSRLLQVARAHLEKSRTKRNTRLALRARLREIKSTMPKRQAHGVSATD